MKAKRAALVLMAIVGLLLPVTAKASLGTKIANAYIYGYDCRHSLTVTSGVVSASTSAMYRNGTVLSYITCQVKGTGNKNGGGTGYFDSGVIYSYGASVSASAFINAGMSETFIGGSSTAYFLGGIWSNLSE